ncbi:MAG: hypothetical protein WCS34_09635 [Bacteroidales bacterium]
MDFRKRQNISLDIVLFGFNGEQLYVLLSKRYLNLYNEEFPVINDWKLVGKHVLKSERLDATAKRIFRTLGCNHPPFFHQFRTFGNPKRINKHKDVLWSESKQDDPQTLTVGYYALTYIPDFETSGVNIHYAGVEVDGHADAIAIESIKNPEYVWFPIDKLPPEKDFAFDHEFIIKEAYQYIKEKFTVAPYVYHLLPAKFTLNSLLTAYECVFGTKIDNRNFRKKIISKVYIARLDEKVSLPNSKKPANLYMFSQDIYDRMLTDKPRNIL